MNPTEQVGLNTFNSQPSGDTVTIEINAARALNLLEDAVAERGEEYKYDHAAAKERRSTGDWPQYGGPSCFYWHGESVGCIAGLALSKAGVPDETLDGMDHAVLNDEATGTSIASLRNWLEKRGIVLSDAAVSIMRVAQESQDNSNTWGEALSEAATLRDGQIDSGIEP